MAENFNTRLPINDILYEWFISGEKKNAVKLKEDETFLDQWFWLEGNLI